MTFLLNIHAVDGATNTGCSTADLKLVADILAKFDHEGSSISLTIEGYGEEVYKLIEALS